MRKSFLKSKTFWSVFLTGAIGIYESLRQNGYPLPEIPGSVLVILAALGLYGRATARAPLGFGMKDNEDENGE